MKSSVQQRLLRNRTLAPEALRASAERILSRSGMRAAQAEIRSWPEYVPTRLVELTEEAANAGVGAVLGKLERERFGPGSFKVLGGAYAVSLHAAANRRGRALYMCGSAGNHGLGVAWAARRAGGRSVVFVPERTSAARVARIREQDADVRIVGGDYEAALEAAQEAAEAGAVLISDFSERADPVTATVMQGYTVIVDEIVATRRLPTHVFAPAGVGGLAAAILAAYSGIGALPRPRMVIVEPAGAACVFESLRAGRRVRLPTPPSTRLSPLACRVPSAPAWPILRTGVDWAVKVTDEEVDAAGAALGRDGRVADDNCGATALAGIRAVASDPMARRAVGLGPDSTVLVIVTE